MRPGDSPRVADLGELALLERIATRVARAGLPGGGVVLGIGDDTAALRPTPGALVLATTDALVEDVHFRRATGAAADVGWKALAINASDIAAMGGAPRHAVISLALPGDLEAAWVDGLYEGLLEMAAEAQVAVVGGNLAQSPAIVVDVMLLGEVAPDHLVRRTGARAGDRIAVTGTLGRAAGGLVALERIGGASGRASDRPSDALETAPPGDALARLLAAQRRPKPRLREGRALASTGAVRSMMDISDGLLLDLWRMCEACGLGVRLDARRVPVDPDLAAVASALASALASSATRASGAVQRAPSPLDLALTGGEDYELLFTVAPHDAEGVLRRLAEETGTPATLIGEFTEHSAGRVVIEEDGQAVPLDPGGWTHFGRGNA